MRDFRGVGLNPCETDSHILSIILAEGVGALGMNFFWQIAHIADVHSLESLSDQLVSEAADQNLTWSERMEIYKKLPMINERIKQLERE